MVAVTVKLAVLRTQVAQVQPIKVLLVANLLYLVHDFLLLQVAVAVQVSQVATPLARCRVLVEREETELPRRSAVAVLLTPGEAAVILANCPDDLLPGVAIAMFCGLRQAEISRLNWRNVNLAQGIITVGSGIAKTHAPCAL